MEQAYIVERVVRFGGGAQSYFVLDPDALVVCETWSEDYANLISDALTTKLNEPKAVSVGGDSDG